MFIILATWLSLWWQGIKYGGLFDMKKSYYWIGPIVDFEGRDGSISSGRQRKTRRGADTIKIFLTCNTIIQSI